VTDHAVSCLACPCQLLTPHQTSDLPALEEGVYQAVEDISGVLRSVVLALEVLEACPSVGTRRGATGFEVGVGSIGEVRSGALTASRRAVSPPKSHNVRDINPCRLWCVLRLVVGHQATLQERRTCLEVVPDHYLLEERVRARASGRIRIRVFYFLFCNPILRAKN